ncbi:hypothetical protein ACT3TZ_04905 [Brachybacterium sp. AOP25-B2-12]|uniref:hypothetical protein n=1 Tax=Brachybacterium sp. AOP25-B2-12 TaxID=3457710 RepID=UPI004033FB96
MTRTIQFPSSDLPAKPRLALEVPDDWELVVVPGVEIAVAEPRPRDRFRTNLVVSVQRMPPGYDLERARTDLERRKAALPELEEIGTGPLESAGRTWLASEYGYTQAGGTTVVQAVRYAILDRGPVVDVVEVVGSCGADVADEHIEEIRTAQDSVRADAA